MKIRDIFQAGQTAYKFVTNFGYGSEPEIKEVTVKSTGTKYVTDTYGYRYWMYDDGYVYMVDASRTLLFPDKASLEEYHAKYEIQKNLMRKYRITLNHWETYSLGQLQAIQELIANPSRKPNPLESEVDQVAERDQDDSLLSSMVQNNGTYPGITADVINTWKNAKTEQERKSIEGMFLIFTGVEFSEFVANCEKEESV